MPIESANYINDLVTANPLSGDPFADGDNHIRLIKQVLRNTFPSANTAFAQTHVEMNRIAGVNASASELNRMNNATVTAAELNRLSGVTGNVQAQINNKPPKWQKYTMLTGNLLPYRIYAAISKSAAHYPFYGLSGSLFNVGDCAIVCMWRETEYRPYVELSYDVQIIGKQPHNGGRIYFDTTPMCIKFVCVDKVSYENYFVAIGDDFTIES